MRRLSLYAGAGTSVNPSIENMTQTTPTAAVGRARSPSAAAPIEVGAKWDGFGGKLLLNAALFRTDKINARTPGLPGEPATVLDGKQRVDGFELGATGRITKAWDVIASYTYLDSEMRRVEHAGRGRQPPCQRARAQRVAVDDLQIAGRASRSAAASATSARATPTSPTRAQVDDYCRRRCDARLRLRPATSRFASTPSTCSTSALPTRSAAATSFRVRADRCWRRCRSGV